MSTVSWRHAVRKVGDALLLKKKEEIFYMMGRASPCQALQIRGNALQEGRIARTLVTS